jgi:hypothetical protein
MFWDDLVRRWRRDSGVVDRAMLRAVGGHVAVLPAPRRQRRSRLILLLIIAIVVAAALQASSGGISHSTDDASGSPVSNRSTVL